MKPRKLILASTSPIRRRLLKDAGLAFTAIRPDVDEEKIKKKSRGENLSIPDTAIELARQKARSISGGKNAIIIGADQILEMDGQIYDKPKSMDEAKTRLLEMRGKTHRLIGGLVCLDKRDNSIWTHSSITKLTMRNFSNDFLNNYLSSEGEEILYTVGAYKFEERGAQLFERVEGDFFSILGLSLLPLLGHLRHKGIAEE